MTDLTTGELPDIVERLLKQAGSLNDMKISIGAAPSLILREAADLIVRLRAAPPPVAREPTEAMLNAARDWSVAKFHRGIGNDAATGCWQAMWDAAT